MKQQPNPLVPQGTFESQARGKSHVRIAVFTILAIHVVVLGALLIQGCKRDKEDTTASTVPTNDFSSIPPFGGTNDIVTTPATSNMAPIPPFSTPPAASSNFGMTPTVTPGAPPFVPTTPTSPAIVNNVAEGTPANEHVIVKGDTFATLATKYGASVRSIQSANPNLNPTRLKIGDKVKIPAKAATTGSSGNSAFASGGTGTETYAVKSGDTLSKIAKSHGTTIKEVQKLNNLSTTQIKVGQKLKMPSRASAPATATPNPASPGGTAPTGFPPAGVPAPAQ